MRIHLMGSRAALLVSVGSLLLSVPSFAANDYVCATLPAELRAIAGTKHVKTARAATRYIATAERLCEASNELAAKKKLNVAMRKLDVDGATLRAQSAER